MTYNHAPKDYKCPICLGVKGVENEDTLLRQADLVYKDDLVSVFINSFWIESVEGHPIVVTNDHYENLFEVPENVGTRIFEVTKKVALALKHTYKCDGITVRQNNEPAGEQRAFHFHQHIYPRYEGDTFENPKKRLSKPEERITYVNKLKKFL
jgi:histidine triad (HIT) family protein